MTFSLRQIQYFIATADAGKVSAAAANVSVSQSAITSAIKGLEDSLGRRLFDRHSNGVTLTYDGHQFLQHARNITAAVSEATRAPSRTGRSISGRIKVGVSYTVVGYFLPPILFRFQRTFPEINIQLFEQDREEIEEGLVKGRLDAAVMLVSNLENKVDIRSETLIRSRRRLWACADHDLLQKEEVGLEDVAREPYLMLTVDEAETSAMRYWSETPFRPNVIFRTSAVEALRGMVASGMGITILSDMVYRPWSLEGQRIEVKTLAGHVHTMDVGLGWRRNAELSPPARAFCEFLTHFISSGMTGAPHLPE